MVLFKKGFGNEKSGCNWTKKENKIQEKCLLNADDKKEEKKEGKEVNEKRGPNEMLIPASNSAPPEYQKPECMVIDLSSIEVRFNVVVCRLQI